LLFNCFLLKEKRDDKTVIVIFNEYSIIIDRICGIVILYLSIKWIPVDVEIVFLLYRDLTV